jgi:hypothetical protein
MKFATVLIINRKKIWCFRVYTKIFREPLTSDMALWCRAEGDVHAAS